MEDLSSEALQLAELLIAARDPESLYRAFEIGLGSIYEHHSMVASFAFDQGGPISTWSKPKRPEHTPEYWMRQAQMHPGFAFAREHPGIQVARCSDTIDDVGLDRLPFYIEFVEPEGYRHAMAILVWQGLEQVVGYVAINRTRAQGDFTEDEKGLALRLQPLVAAAYGRIVTTQKTADARIAQETLLATLPIAAVVYSTRDNRVLFHNRAAREALSRWSGKAAQKRPRAITARTLPVEILAACAQLPVGQPRAGSPIALTSARAPMRAVLRKMDTRSHFANDVVLIVIEDDEDATSRKPSAPWLRIARRLSNAEQDVAKLAARGLTNAEIGKRLGKSALTVKKQLESVFAKARVASRAELAAVVGGLATRRR